MKLIIPKIVEKLNLSDYAEEWGDQTMSVWVNPTKEISVLHDQNIDDANSVIVKLAELKAERETNGDQWFEEFGKTQEADLIAALEVTNKNAMDWYSIIWSQGVENTRVTAEEVEELAETSQETDPMFYQWICAKTIEMIFAHRVNRKN
jgi:hypothetical protein